MKKVVVSKERKTREYMANPHMNAKLNERLRKSGCTRYNRNKKITDLENGYLKIESR